MTAMKTKYARKTQVIMNAGASIRIKRSMGALIVALCLSAGTAFAQGTPMPIPLAQWFDNTGAVLNGGGLCVFRAGTSTLASTYTTAALSVANPNPIVMNAAGRPTSGGVFLTPGESYKFILKDASVTTCVPDTGVTIWSVDNVQATPNSSAVVDFTVTAGESIAAGDAAFLSDGSGGLNAGQIYRMDADLAYKSTAATIVGMAANAITSGASGTLRMLGSVTVTGPLSPGLPYYAGATPGAIVTTPPTNSIRIGTAQSATSFLVGYTQATAGPRGPPCGRLTLTTGVPVTRTDVTAATIIYYTPAGSCNTIFLYNGTGWAEYAFAELSIAVPATTNTGYDVYAYDNAGVVALELTAWTNLTTRATAVVMQNGVWSKTGVLTRRLVGSFRTTGVSGQTEDSLLKRYVSNVDNRARRRMQRIDATTSWNYSNTTVRQANAAVANQLDVFVSLAEVAVEVTLIVSASNDTAGRGGWAGIGINSLTTFSGLLGQMTSPVANYLEVLAARVTDQPAVGSTVYSWNESNDATGVWTYYGQNATVGNRYESGLNGWVEG